MGAPSSRVCGVVPDQTARAQAHTPPLILSRTFQILPSGKSGQLHSPNFLPDEREDTGRQSAVSEDETKRREERSPGRGQAAVGMGDMCTTTASQQKVQVWPAGEEEKVQVWLTGEEGKVQVWPTMNCKCSAAHAPHCCYTATTLLLQSSRRAASRLAARR